MINFQKKWFEDDCNNTCAITFPINEQSTVIDLGAYKGIWANQIIQKYNPNVILVEPNYELCLFLKEKFKNNPKVKVINIGISDINKTIPLFMNEDGSSFHIKTQNIMNVSCITMKELLTELNIDYIDLMQTNIEGEEYCVLNNMIDTNVISKFKNLQVQFHDFIEGSVDKRIEIQNKLKNLNFKNIYDYPFVFEAWRKNDNL